MPKPMWATPNRQAHLVRLFVESGGFCIFGHKPCRGTAEVKTVKVCAWGNTACGEPQAKGELCRFKPDEGKPHLPCFTRTVIKYRWHCAYADNPCYAAYQAHYENWATILIRDWIADDRAARQAEAKVESKALHSLGERRYPLRGQFNAIGKDIFYAEQPSHYIDGFGISGLTYKPFAKVRIASSYMRLFVNLGDALKGVPKVKRRKAVRYGKALPVEAERRIEQAVSEAVRHYLSNR